MFQIEKYFLKKHLPAKPNMGKPKIVIIITSAGKVVVTQPFSKHFPLEHRILRTLLFVP